MQTAVVQTRKITGLDYRVWLAIIACWVLCLGFFVYRQAALHNGNGQPCAQAAISMNGKGGESLAFCEPDRFVIFQLSVSSTARVEWDFGDGTGEAGPPVQQHKFAATGSYRVVATVNGRCEYVQEMMVKTPVAIDEPAPAVKIYPDSARTSPLSPLGFSAVANFPVQSYEWNIVGTTVFQTGERVTFSFPTARKYTVQLVVNGNPATAVTKVIEIVSPSALPDFPAQTGPSSVPDMSSLGPLIKNDEPHGKTAPDAGAGSADKNAPKDSVKNAPSSSAALEIDPDSFKGLLQGVLDGNNGATVAKLNPYLDYKETTKVAIDGSGEPVSLDAFCNNYRKKKIDTLGFQKDNYKSIQLIKVKMKKGFFAKLNPFQK